MKRRLIVKEMRKCFRSRSAGRAKSRQTAKIQAPEHPSPCPIQGLNERGSTLYDYLVFYADDFMRDFGPLHA